MSVYLSKPFALGRLWRRVSFNFCTSGLDSVFFFSSIGYFKMAREPNLLYFLGLVRRDKIDSYVF